MFKYFKASFSKYGPMTYFKIFCGAAKNENYNLISALENKIKSREGRKIEPFNLHFCQAPTGESQAHERHTSFYCASAHHRCCIVYKEVATSIDICHI